jgi:hypothetical protein
MGMVDQSHESAALRPGKRPGIHGYRRLGGPQERSGSGEMRKISPPTGIPSPNRPSHSELLYRRLHPCPVYCINPSNPICHLLILLGDLTFKDPCIVSIFQYISNKTQRYTVYFYLETALHVSGGTSTHHQERIHLYLQHLIFVTPLLLSAAIVEELEPV